MQRCGIGNSRADLSNPVGYIIKSLCIYFRGNEGNNYMWTNYVHIINTALVEIFLAIVSQVHISHGAGFDHADTQSTERDTQGFRAINFGNPSRVRLQDSPRCKVFPGEQDWPADKWHRFNVSLGGTLLKLFPPEQSATQPILHSTPLLAIFW